MMIHCTYMCFLLLLETFQRKWGCFTW